MNAVLSKNSGIYHLDLPCRLRSVIKWTDCEYWQKEFDILGRIFNQIGLDFIWGLDIL